MNLWHHSAETQARCVFADGDWWLEVALGTWPVAPGQSVNADYRVLKAGRVQLSGSVGGAWTHNQDGNSYWRVRLGPFAAGEEVDYSINGRSASGRVVAGPFRKRVGPKLFLALLWHQHQPLYHNGRAPDAPLLLPPARLHALRDYDALAAMVEAYPKIRLTINLTSVLLRQIRDYSGEQFKILRNVVAIHRRLQEAGQIEVCTTPCSHPILDQDGAKWPAPFHSAEDADAQVAKAVELYRELFGCAPRGMWPAEGTVGESSVPHFTRHGIRWIASDADVLRRSGEWGYEAHRPEVLAQAWRAGSEEPEECVTIFFRDPELSNEVGFHYGQRDPEEVAAHFVEQLQARFGTAGEQERIVSVILEGENTWGSSQQVGRRFLQALCRRLSEEPEICTVTPNEFIEGNAQRGIAAHPLWQQPRVEKLARASWMDEAGSHPGCAAEHHGRAIGPAKSNAASRAPMPRTKNSKKRGALRNRRRAKPMTAVTFLQETKDNPELMKT